MRMGKGVVAAVVTATVVVVEAKAVATVRAWPMKSVVMMRIMDRESLKGRNAQDKDGADEDKEALQHAVAMAEGWARRLEGADLRGRVLVPSALRALQVLTGRPVITSAD